jgi:hypothetical protein
VDIRSATSLLQAVEKEEATVIICEPNLLKHANNLSASQLRVANEKRPFRAGVVKIGRCVSECKQEAPGEV